MSEFKTSTAAVITQAFTRSKAGKELQDGSRSGSIHVCRYPALVVAVVGNSRAKSQGDLKLEVSK